MAVLPFYRVARAARCIKARVESPRTPPTPFMPSAAEGGVSRHARSGNHHSCLKKARSPLDAIAARSPESLDTRGLRPRTRDDRGQGEPLRKWPSRSDEHTSEPQSLMRISYAVF